MEADDQKPAPEAAVTEAVNKKLKWYVVHTYSGFEQKAKKSLEERAKLEGLEAHFGPPIPGPTEAGTAAGAVAAPTLAVYHAAFEDASRLRGLLADPATHAALLPEGWVVDGLVRRRDGFDRTLVEGAAVLRRERVALLPDGFTVEADGPLALFRTRTLRIEPRPEGSRLRLLATLRDPVPPRGLPEGTRRRLVFELGSELLALDRHSTEE